MIELSEVNRTAKGDDDDIESRSINHTQRQQQSGSSLSISAMRRQNGCFGVVLTLVLMAFAAYIVSVFYSEPNEYNVAGDYDAQFGAVSEEATNAKVEEALENQKKKDHIHGVPKPYNATPGGRPWDPGNPWNPLGDNPWDRPHQGEHGKVPDWVVTRENHTSIMWAAQQDRWNRTHPGVPFPYAEGPGKFNRTNYYHDHDATMDILNRTHKGGWRPDHPGEGPGKPAGKGDRGKPGKSGATRGQEPNGVPNTDSSDGNHGLDPHEKNVDSSTKEPAPETLAPLKPTTVPAETTAKPVNPTSTPRSTRAPLKPITAPTETTAKPVNPTSTPRSTRAPIKPTPASVELTSKPTQTTATVEPIPAPVKPTMAHKSTNIPRQETSAPTETTAVKATGHPVNAIHANGQTAKDYSAWHAVTVRKEDGVKFETLDVIAHDGNSFTQGLTFNDGILYESSGLYGASSVRILNPTNGEVTKQIMIPRSEFGEGMTVFKDFLVQITWKSRQGHVYFASDLKKKKNFNYTTSKNDEGWGITYDTERDELIVTDGSDNLVIWKSDCWRSGVCTPIRTVPCIRLNGQRAKNLNEIEFWRGRVLANVWYEDVLLVINPVTGKVEKEYNMAELWPNDQRNARSDVMNGISITEDPDVLYVTGKYWAQLFKIKLLA